MYYHRAIESRLNDYLNFFPVVAITGPRQSGKSTLLQHQLTEYTYVSFDDYNQVEFFNNDPEGFMALHKNKVIFDEAQKAPEIFNYIKLAVDQDRDNYGKYIVTGSSQFTLLKNITESLAGRIGLLTLLPLNYNEVPPALRNAAIVNGCYPELVKRNYLGRNEWYGAYFETYLTKDLRELIKISDLKDFRRFISLLASNTSQIMNMSNYAKNLGVTVQTINRWLSALEAGYIIFSLQPFYNNFGKRIIKSPKIYFYDTGLVAYLTGVDTEESYHKGPMAGSLFENYMVSEIKKQLINESKAIDMFYLRTSSGAEVDLIIDKKIHLEFIEIKHGSTFKIKMLEHMKKFMEKEDKGVLIYNGKSMPHSDVIQIKNYQDYLAQF